MKTVFIVDDVDTILLIVKNLLDGKFITYALPSASRMFKLMERITPDLILMDIDMPEMDGFEAIKRLKNDPKHSTIPVIFLTGKNDEESEIRGFELGALDFINKPFSNPVLLHRIETHLELVSLYKTVQQKNEELINTQDAKNKILSMISHDLINYVGTTISACNMMISKDVSLVDNKYIKLVNESSNNIISLLKDVLTMNKISVDDISNKLSKHDIGQEIKVSLDNLVFLAKKKNITVDYKPCDEPLLSMLNVDKFVRMIDNLCLNAVKFTLEGGKVILKLRKDEGFAYIHIIDTGIGMDNEILSTLFVQYQKSGRTGTAGEASTGLGLYIVKQILDLHQGSIEVISQVGLGSEFIVKLPILKDI